MSIPNIQLPVKFQLRPSLFSSGANNTTAGIVVSCTNQIQDYRLILPTQNAAGMLNNDGTGKLRWLNPQETTIGVQTITATTADQTGIIKMNQLGVGACSIRYQVPGITYNMGIDQTDNNIFKLSRSSVLGSSDIIKFTSGALLVPANLILADTVQSGAEGVFRMGSCNFYALNTDNNLFIGKNSGNLTYVTSTANENTAFGKNTLSGITTAFSNTAVGDTALTILTEGYENCAIGHLCLSLATTAYQMTAIGTHALSAAIDSNNCVALGFSALSFSTRSRNTAIGARAGYSLTVGEDNTLVGYNANTTNSAFNNSVALGSGSTVNASNKVQLGNTSIISMGFGPISLTTNQIKQLSNLPNNPAILLQSTAWTNLAGLNQSLSTTSSPTFSNLSITGTFTAASFAQSTIISSIQTLTANTILNSSYSIIRADCTTGPIILTLPLSITKPSQEIKIVKVDNTSNTCTISCQASNTISYTYPDFTLVSRGESVHLVSMGVDNTWNIF